MNWFIELFTAQSFIQAVLCISLICAVGLALGKIRIFGVSLGATFVFFAGIIAGHFGLAINPDMLAALQNFGLLRPDLAIRHRFSHRPENEEFEDIPFGRNERHSGRQEV